MKVTIKEMREMIAEAVRRTLREAKKPKELPRRSEESVEAERERQLRGLPGYAHGSVLDMSKPLGRRNRIKRQGASNIGNWTSEGLTREEQVEAIRHLVRCIIEQELRKTPRSG